MLFYVSLHKDFNLLKKGTNWFQFWTNSSTIFLHLSFKAFSSF